MSRSGSAARLAAIAEDAAGCRDCPLWERATQTVFGAGSPTARLVLVGEQPGDREDEEGEPFVGPAGRLLDDALEAAEIPRSDVYITNAVKHFKWEERGKRRIHKRPNRSEVVACRQWLEAELDTIGPGALLTLGATAGKALFGSKFRIKDAEDAVLEFEGYSVIATMHPSAALRAPDSDARQALFDRIVGDLRRAQSLAS